MLWSIEKMLNSELKLMLLGFRCIIDCCWKLLHGQLIPLLIDY